MREIKLLISEVNGTQLGELDLEDFEDFGLKLTKAISSITDIQVRSTSYSLDFKVPKTKNNNKLLNGLRFINHEKSVLSKKICVIIAEGNQVDNGFLYAYESTFEDSYKLVFKGGNNTWVELIKGLDLNQLHWRDYATGTRGIDATERFDSPRISILNASNSTVGDLIYPYMDRNNSGAVVDFRPMIHYRSFFLALADAIGYTFDSDFLESDWIKGNVAFTDAFSNAYTHLGLGIDPAFYFTRDQNDLIAILAQYKTTGLTPALYSPWSLVTWNNDHVLGNLGNVSVVNYRTTSRFPNLLNTSIEDNSSLFTVADSTYTVPVGGVYEIDFDFVYEWAFYDTQSTVQGWRKWDSGGFSPFLLRPPNFKWVVVKNNTQDYVIDGTIIWQGSAPVQANIQTIQNQFTFGTGDKINVFLELVNDATGFGGSVPWTNYGYLNGSLDFWKIRIFNDSKITFKAKPSVQLGDDFRINSHIPSGIKALDLLQDCKILNNLYFDVDLFRKTIKLEPRDDFYTTERVDITDKIDLKTSPVINYLTNYKNKITFGFASDSNDKYLEQWNKIYDKTYGEYEHEFANAERFENGESIIRTNILCPTIQAVNAGTSWVNSVIKQEWLDADNLGKGVNDKYRPRIFQIVRGEQYDTANVVRNTTFTGARTFAIMEEFGNLPTFEDRKLTFVGERGLVWDYYSKTLSNIQDTAVVTLKAKISLYDFINWDFRKRYYINSPEEIKGEYITESIENFDVNKEVPTTLKLSRYKDFPDATVTGGGGNVNINTQNPAQPPQPLMVIVNGAIVPVLDNNYNELYG